jgi:hypothetical protein
VPACPAFFMSFLKNHEFFTVKTCRNKKYAISIIVKESKTVIIDSV